jgi:GNAT superfamily N-acetyltransferase
MAVVKDEWLGELLGKPAYHIGVTDSLLQTPGQAFFDVKIPVDNVNEVRRLQKYGFFLVDTNVQLVRPYGCIPPGRSQIRLAQADDEMGVRKIARDSFTFDRFHRDPLIENSTASKIKEAWAGNFFGGHRGRWMVVAEYEGRIVGFVLLLYGDDGVVSIDLIAVDFDQRGKGIARDMISFAMQSCVDPNSKLMVGTQIANFASLALYASLGFKVVKAAYVLHYHQQVY